MEVDKIIAVCGVSCTECKVYHATKNNDIKALETIAIEWTKGMGRTFTVDDLLCDGCRVEGGRRSSYCGSCGINLCAKAQEHETCAHCNKCPCEKIVAPPAIDALNKLKEQLKAR